MVATIQVSYGLLVGYISFVVVATLLVGLLPPLVNLPECKEDKAVDNLLNIAEGIADDIIPQDKPIDTHHDRVKRHAEAEEKLRSDYRNLKEQIESRLDSSPVLRRHYNPQATPFERINICSEILSPVVGVEYPWYNPRLPTYIQPINYDMEMLLSNLDFLTYDGYINITFGLNESTNLLLFHNGGNEVPLFQYLLDKDGNKIDIECVGAFLDLRNDYFVMRTARYLQPNEGPFTIDFLFIDFFTGIDDGIFRIRYGPKEENKTMILSKFQPISARKAFPCFDEPGFKTTWDVTLYHREDFYALFNTPVASFASDPLPGIVDSVFQTSPKLPTYFVAFATFNKNDFGALTKLTNNGVNVTLYARKQFIDGGYAQDALDMSVNIYNALSDIFRNVDASAIPPKIDILAVPEYQVDAVAHYGFPIFEEDKILFKKTTSSERDLQTTALLIAKIFAEFWFGNFITPHFWDELWVQEGFADYIKYRAVDEAYPTWNILDQFITEELIQTILLDGFPSSHPIQKPISNPYEIEEYFDLIESAKTASILRMIEKEIPIATLYDAFTQFLNHDPWGIANLQTFYDALPAIGSNNWEPEDFFDRWTLQSNYPLVIVELVDNAGVQNVKFTQYRGLNTNYSLFSDDILYPSPWNFTWYIPIDCSFGNGSAPGDAVREREYYLDSREATFAVPNSGSTKWTWVHCDRQFVGYMELDYTRDNWKALADGLKQGNPEFTAEDRAQIIHNLFQNAYTERGDYFQLRDLLDYMTNERDYLPWRVLDIQAARMDEVLQYRRTFNSFANYIAYLARSLETSIDPWTAGENHIEELLKETAINLACRMQDSICLNKVSELWKQLVPYLENGDFESSPIPAFARQVIYDYHIQNTYEIEDWDLIFHDYEIILDENEHRKLLSSLTYSRLPWLLTGVITGVGNEFIRKIDFFLIMKYMVRNPLGRELAWDYLRTNFDLLIETYSEDDPRLGTLLIDITESFETEFMFYELLSFVFYTTSGATSFARFKALEYCSTNIVWLDSNEAEIEEAFSAPRSQKASQRVSYYKNPLLEPIDRSDFDSVAFIQKAREALFKAMNVDRSDVFADYLIRKLAQ